MAEIAPARDRITAFDVARGVGLVGMVTIHVVYHWASPTAWTGLPALVLGVAGGPLAMPVVTLLLGASLAFSRRTSRRQLAARGLGFLAGAFLLNLARGTVPLALARSAGVAPAGTDEYSVWGLAIAVDVLALAGMTLLAVALLGPLLRRPAVSIALAVLVVLAAPILRPLAPADPVPAALAGLLFATGPTDYYPVFPWAGFALLGMSYGQAVRRGPADAAIARWGVGGALVALVGGAVLARDLPAAIGVAWYWEMPPALALAVAGTVLAWIAASDRVVRLAGETAPLRLLATWGRRTTRIYVTHWPIVAWGVGLVGFRTLDGPASVIAIGAVLVATHLGAAASYRIAPAAGVARKTGTQAAEP